MKIKNGKLEVADVLGNRFSEEALSFAKALTVKKAEDITLIDVSELTIIADYFIIASGRSTTQVKSICDEMIVEMEKLNFKPIRKEGYNAGRWIVVDYGDFLIHIFHKEEREFYNIERLWVNNDNKLDYAASEND